MNSETPIADMGRYGRALAGRFKKLGVKTAGDLLMHPPIRYEDLSEVKKINELMGGETVTIQATVEMVANRRSPQKRMPITEAVLSDGTGKMTAVWFRQPYIASALKPGTKASFAGKVSAEYGKGLQLISPIYEPGERGVHTGRIIPIYPTTANLTQKHIRAMVHLALPAVLTAVDPLPDGLRSEYGLMPLAEALKEIHYPTSSANLDRARRRLQFDELLLHQLLALRIKDEVHRETGISIKFAEKRTQEFVGSLPFTLTDDQRKAAWAILKDMEKGEPMHRLLDGDVGSGKTVVAAIAAVNVAASGGQAAFMAPTEVLAKQHYETLARFLPTASLALRTNAYQEGDSDAAIIIGTHALLEDSVPMPKLTLAVVDEQHRFGVEQRAELLKKRGDGKLPHLLSMTATPIPRTLHLALYGDLDISLLRSKPKNRLPITTKILKPNRYGEAHDLTRSEVGDGRQAFYVSPVIEASDVTGAKSATELFEHLTEEVFPDLRVGLLHGRLKSAEKEKTMAAFAAGKIQVLVATAVIEVGIDIPNATVMVITGAERFGLAQLHQFRGRVGRSERRSYCFAFAPDGAVSSRLRAFAECSDGFDLAERDLQLRGPGELFGTRQSGIEEMKFATFTDLRLVEEAREAAASLISQGADLPTAPLLFEKLKKHEQALHLE
jgi:ATP-dependent DNA helicase RecG